MTRWCLAALFDLLRQVPERKHLMSAQTRHLLREALRHALANLGPETTNNDAE